MPPSATSVVVPQVLWLSSKTPTNFNSAPDRAQKTIIAVNSQRYYTKKREEQGALLLELQQQGSYVPPVLSTPFGILPTVAPSHPCDEEEVDERRASSNKTRKHGYREANQTERSAIPAEHPKSRAMVEQCSILTRALQGGNSDPFASTPIPLCSLKYAVMSTIRPMSLHIIWANEVGTPNGTEVLIPTQKRSYKTYLGHEAAMHALFAYCWSAMARLHPHNKDLYYCRALEHEIRVTSILQPLLASLASTPDNIDAALQTVALLCSAALFRSRFDAVFMHLKGLKEIIRYLGGINKLHWLRRDAVIFLVVKVAANTRTRTILHPASWDPGSWSEQNETKAAGRLAPGGPPEDLYSCSNRVIQHSTNVLSDIFAALRELIEVDPLKPTLVNGEQGETSRLFRWSQLRRQAVRARILNHWCDLTKPTRAVDPSTTTFPTPTRVHHASIAMCLCLALHVFVAFGLESSLLKQHWVSTIQIWHIMLLRCIHKLGFDIERIDCSRDGACDLLWICAIGAFVEDAYLPMVLRDKPTFWIPYDADEVDIRWFSVRFGVLARRVGYEDYDGVAATFEQRYVHIPALQDEALSRLFTFGWSTS